MAPSTYVCVANVEMATKEDYGVGQLGTRALLFSSASFLHWHVHYLLVMPLFIHPLQRVQECTICYYTFKLPYLR